MAPVVKQWSDLHTLCESFAKNRQDFLYTTFAAIDDDVFYFGRLNIPKLKVTFEQFTSALEPIPDEDLYPELLSANESFKIATENIGDDTNACIKRPRLSMYDIYKENDVDTY